MDAVVTVFAIEARALSISFEPFKHCAYNSVARLALVLRLFFVLIHLHINFQIGFIERYSDFGHLFMYQSRDERRVVVPGKSLDQSVFFYLRQKHFEVISVTHSSNSLFAPGNSTIKKALALAGLYFYGSSV